MKSVLLATVIAATSFATVSATQSASAESAQPQTPDRACDYPDWEPAYLESLPPRTVDDGKEPPADAAIDWLSDKAAQTNIEALWTSIDEASLPVLGGYVDLGQRELVIVADPAPGVTESIKALSDTASIPFAVDVRVGCESLATLEGLRNDLYERSKRGEFVGEAHTFGIDARLGVVEILASPDTKAFTLENLGYTRDDPIVINTSAAPPEPLGRCGDLPAHYGGSLYKQGSTNNCNGNHCTTGFKVKRNWDGKIGMSTAGHCRVNTGWSSNLYSKNSFFGEFFNWSYGTSGYDWGFISGSTYSNRFHSNPCCPNSRAVSGVAQNYIGDVLCISGGRTTARCSVVVNQLRVMNCDIWGNCAENDRARRSNGTTACQGGDSGAPWFDGNRVQAIQSFGTSSGGPTCYGNRVQHMQNSGFTVMTT